MRRAAGCSIAGALIALCSADAQVYLRGQAEPFGGTVEAVGADGVHLRGAGPEGNRPAVIAWDAVRRVDGEFTDRARAYSDFSEQAWRARSRLERGDIEESEPVFERLAASITGQSGATAAGVFAGLMSCRVRRGALATATVAWLDWHQARAERDVHPAIWVGGPSLGVSDIDEQTRLAPALGPFWLRRTLGQEEHAGGPGDATGLPFETTARLTDPATVDLAALYRAAARFEAGLEPRLQPLSTAGEGVLLVRDVVLARAGSGQERADARDRLAARLNDAGNVPWKEAWCRTAIGRSLILEADEDSKRAGVVQLLQIPARLSWAAPQLVGIALAEAAVVCWHTGDPAGARALKSELSHAWHGQNTVEWTALGVISGAPDSPGGAVAASATDPMEAYLERLALTRLLAVHLEGRLDSAPKADRPQIAERLAKEYAALLEHEVSGEERRRLEQKARRLLVSVPDADSFDLRISVNRALYQHAEELAEKFRLRLVGPAEAAEAEATLGTLAATFADIGHRAHRRVDTLEKAENGQDLSDRGREELESVRRSRSLAYFYAGWCSCYLALLGKGESHAVEALKDFGWLLNAPGRVATADKLPSSLLKYEHIGRAAIGCAMAASARGNDVEALRWLDAVEQSDELSASVREQLPARRMSVLGAAKRWADLERYVRRLRSGAPGQRVGGGRDRDAEPLPAALARLLAVMALEADRRIAGPQVESLAATALADLVARKEVGQVLDLVSRHGTAALGAGGFIAHYVRGVQAFESARAAHAGSGADAGEPVADPKLKDLYRSAAALLDGADHQPDAGSFPRERSRAAATRGLALLFAGEFAQAADLLESAWASSGAADKNSDAEETLWQCVLAWSRAAASAPGDSAVAKRRENAAALFLKSYPESARAPRLLVMQASSGALSDDDALRALGAVGKESAFYEPARRQMARIYYARFRAAAGQERDRAAFRFLGVAEELFEVDVKAAQDPDGRDRAAAAERAISRGRQLLDALLSTNAPDAAHADRVLEAVRGVAFASSADLSPHGAELLYRTVQILLARGNDGEAAAALEQFGTMPDRGAAFGAGADRLVFRQLAAKWTAEKDDADAGATSARLARVGARIADSAAENPGELPDAGLLALESTAAAAATAQFRRTGSVEMRAIALRLDRRVLEAQPRAEQPLRRLAENARAEGDLRTALECWRTLLDAYPTGSPAWFEAKYQMLNLLIEVDPERARAAIAAHRALYPNLGPEPWGGRIRELDELLGSPLPASPSGKPSGEPDR